MIEKNAENDTLLAFCHNGSVASVFMNSVLGALANDARRGSQAGGKRRLVEYYDAIGPYIYDNRSRITEYFLEHTNYQWLWFLDNDVEFPDDTLYRMLDAAEENDVKLLGGAYWNQYTEGECYLSWLVFTQEGVRAMQTLPSGDKPVEVTAVGMGCTLIHRSVVQDVADMHANDPWDTFAADMLVTYAEGGFSVARTPQEVTPEVMKGRTVKNVERMGEDVTFCCRARAAGYPAYGLPSVVVEHFKAHFMIHGNQETTEKRVLLAR